MLQRHGHCQGGRDGCGDGAIRETCGQDTVTQHGEPRCTVRDRAAARVHERPAGGHAPPTKSMSRMLPDCERVNLTSRLGAPGAACASETERAQRRQWAGSPGCPLTMLASTLRAGAPPRESASRSGDGKRFCTSAWALYTFDSGGGEGREGGRCAPVVRHAHLRLRPADDAGRATRARWPARE